MSTPTSPLLDEHVELGAHFTDFAGWRMPLRYGSELAEHHVVRHTAGLFDLSHMGEIAVRGPQAGAALDHALVGLMSAVGVGRAKYTLLCAPDGGVLDDLVVYRRGDDDFLIVANAANAGLVYREIADRASGFDVSVSDESATTALIAVQGPAAAAIVGELVDPGQRAAADALRYYAATPATVAGIEVLLSRTGYTGEDGFELYVPNAAAVALWRALLAVTRGHDGLPAGLACRDTLRLEAGMPLYGNELSTRINPYQAGLGRVVRLDKDFVGRDALQAAAAAPPARTLVGLTGTGRRAARAGYPVYAGETEIGAVTSGALSPTLGVPIAMAYLDAAHATPGATVTVDIRGTRAEYRVTTLPFYRRSEQKA